MFLKSKLIPFALVWMTFTWVTVQASTELGKLESRKWIKVSTSNFHIITDLKEKKAIQVASRLEIFRNMYQLAFAKEFPDLERPLKIIAPKKSNIFDLFVGGNHQLRKTNGFFVANNYGNYATVEANRFGDRKRKYATVNASLFKGNQVVGEQSSLNRLFHEYTHYLTTNQYQRNLPFWYSEGFADFLSSTRVQDSGLVIFGEPIDYHLHSINRREWMKMEDLLKITRTDSTDERGSYQVYSQGWLMVHYFLAKPERAKQLEEFVALLSSGHSVDDSMAEALDRTYEQLDAELRRYAKKGKLYYKKINTRIADKEADVVAQELEPTDVLFEFGEFFLNGLSQPNEAERFFKRSIEIQNENANSLASLAKIYMQSDLALGIKYVERALEQSQDSAWVHLVAGDVNSLQFADPNSSPQADSARERALHHYSRAIELQPDNVAAISAKASLYLNEANFNKALEMFQSAYQLAPSSSQARFDLIVSNYSVGRFEQGDKIADIVRQNPHASDQQIASFNSWAAKQRASAAEYFAQKSEPSP